MYSTPPMTNSDKISTSPQAGTFQMESSKKKLEKDPGDAAALTMVSWYETLRNEKTLREADPEWRENNMEYDLRTTDWILEKVRTSEVYAQNLYAAMCNREFMKNDVWPKLLDLKWSCSWRHAGGIIADMRQEGDYVDWYCSGIRDAASSTQYVSESVVTAEIQADLLRLGWIVLEEDLE